jgi:hypothetical protein
MECRQNIINSAYRKQVGGLIKEVAKICAADSVDTEALKLRIHDTINALEAFDGWLMDMESVNFNPNVDLKQLQFDLQEEEA